MDRKQFEVDGQKKYKIDGQKIIWTWWTENSIKLMDRKQFEFDGQKTI